MTDDAPVFAKPVEQPIERLDLAAYLRPAVFSLIERNADPGRVFFAVRTATRMDVGAWTGKRRIWVCCLADEIILVAYGRKPFVEKTGFQDLKESQYNHVTASLMLAPAERLTVRQLKMSPSDAAQVLAQIHTQGG